jgi:predicted GNAT superfamily acetyltransferase
MPTIREISAVDYLPDMWPLLAAHREELTVRKDIMELNPLVEVYRELEDKGTLLSLGVFDDDGSLIGYSINILAPNLHYGDVMMCQNDVLFLREDHRKGTLGLRLMRETESQAKARGAEVMVWHAKPGSNLDQVLQRLRYDVQDIVYTGVL